MKLSNPTTCFLGIIGVTWLPCSESSSIKTNECLVLYLQSCFQLSTIFRLYHCKICRARTSFHTLGWSSPVQLALYEFSNLATRFQRLRRLEIWEHKMHKPSISRQMLIVNDKHPRCLLSSVVSSDPWKCICQARAHDHTSVHYIRITRVCRSQWSYLPWLARSVRACLLLAFRKGHARESALHAQVVIAGSSL